MMVRFCFACPRWGVAVGAAVVVVWLSAAACQAQDEVVLSNGKAEFAQHCATCHGVSATGNGPMAAFLNVPPADLTQLSKKNGGQFPFWRVYRVIDGREEMMAHGSRSMPVWGTHFLLEEGGGPAADSRTIGRILGIVYYLQSIQER
jgi:mono/diheme cytochrome c family protein